MADRSSWKRLNAFGIAIATASCWLAGRFAWEKTVWTWEQGPQMVGFSLMHSGAGLLLFLAFFVAAPIWILLVAICAWRTKSLGTASTRIALLAYACASGVLSIPGWAWERAFIERMASSSKAADLIFHAAARGDMKTVEAYVAHGVPVNSRTCSQGFTPIHGAVAGGDVAMIRFLISQGADVNVTNAYGDSPLCDAEAHEAPEIVELLTSHGARRVAGTAEQRTAASRHFASRSSGLTVACASAQPGEPADFPCTDARWKYP